MVPSFSTKLIHFIPSKQMSESQAEEDLPEKEIGNQGLKKKILRKGNSWQTPLPGDEVHVHYSGKLHGNGEYFDSSREKGAPFTFKLGQGEVIKGWDIGIATMRKGERALYTIPPCLGYGKAGSPPIIPPDSTLLFDIEMVSWKSIRDVAADGGILKKIVREGEGWATPRDADQVLVKYTMRTENKEDVVSESIDGVEFSLTEGFLCPAMSKAVKTMRKGEIADISVKPFYGFGALTNENTNTNSIIGSIPPTSNLSIHLELVSWKSVTDVMGDKKVLKQLIKAGEGYDRPNEGALVKVVCIRKLEDGTITERKGSDQEPFEYLCLEDQIIEGLDRAIMTMRKGEEARVRICSDYFHGCKEKTTELSPLIYEVKLLDFTKEKPFWKMETREKIEACERNKQEGNLLFKSGKFQHASKKYEQASKYIEFDHSFTADEKRQANALKLSCSLNNAACKLKLEDFLEASRLCSKALGIDPCNTKALFRRSQAYLRMSELEKAEIDIKQALALDPNNRDVKLVHKELRQRQKQYEQHEVKFFSAMLSRIE
ncbi:PREDICTED: 70 kDa peptidyl-prolyl isomerase-like isoform X1 [Ipomoea nil]|uniref:70 kDa peptidyl-prolyl isomerase-like isoform X1 n=1 Tax=Ipomoea nil TaxID=35883 RepID=UPI0009015344|nr:PREDICTED: 70 kDa peptidyl-prolyl isomerase-like isoform X1 [Ipomoea nil]XP_019188094.1 PREDICTED: 70 kDa peptidyl-prolyl isomerase-like isoform X1 [Ipomoea nil]